MNARKLGEYELSQSVLASIGYSSGEFRYMVLRTEVEWDVYGRGEGSVSFTSDLGKAHNDAICAAISGKGAIVVDLKDIPFVAMEDLPVVYDNEDE